MDISTIEAMMPYERAIYTELLNNWIHTENERLEKANRGW